MQKHIEEKKKKKRFSANIADFFFLFRHQWLNCPNRKLINIKEKAILITNQIILFLLIWLNIMKNWINQWKGEWGQLTGLRHTFLGMSLEYAMKQTGVSELPPWTQPFWTPSFLHIKTPSGCSSYSSALGQC